MAANTRDAAGDLPDELLLDIFARLSANPVDLLLCAGTCKRWLRLALVAASSRRDGEGKLPQNTTIFLGAFYRDDYLVHGQTVTPTVQKKIPDDDDHSIPGLPTHPRVAGLLENAKPLASRRGLLLVRLMAPVPLDSRKLHLAVCHPLIGGVHLVPPPPLVELHPPFQGRDVTGYALLTGYGGEDLHDDRQRRLAFRVLFTAVRLEGVVYAYSYSSATGSWSAPIMCPPQLRHLTMSGPRAGTVDGRGTTHWLYKDVTDFYTLDVTADAARVSLTKVSIPQKQPQHPPFPCITHGGKLAFLIPADYTPWSNMLQLVTKPEQDEDHEADWIRRDLPLYQGPIIAPLKVIGFAEARGAILVKCYYGLFAFDLEGMATYHLSGSKCNKYPSEFCSTCHGYNSCTHCPYNNFVLYEIDWSSYLLHLSAWNPREEQQGETHMCRHA